VKTGELNFRKTYISIERKKSLNVRRQLLVADSSRVDDGWVSLPKKRQVIESYAL
jgi:hypothetical protein